MIKSPFVFFQRETLMNQLETNKRESSLIGHELDLHEESDEANYNMSVKNTATSFYSTPLLLAFRNLVC